MKQETKPCILVVDDVPENIDVLSSILSENYKVKAAVNGERALKVASGETPPDLILLDIMMPGMDGYEVCQRLKENRKTKNIPVIFVTAMNQQEDEAKGLDLGAIDYLTKPVNPAIVRARVGNVLELVSSRDRMKEMLDKTLTGSIELLVDVLSITHPTAFGRSRDLRRKVHATCKRLGHRNTWSFDVAAMLSQLGCLTLPEELLEKVDRNQPLNEAEQKLYDNHPQVAKRLLQKIPNLRQVAEIIALQNAPLDDDAVASAHPPKVLLGASLLQMAISLEEGERRKRATPQPQPAATTAPKPAAQETPSDTAPPGPEPGSRQELPLNELVVGMIVDEEFKTRKGAVLVRGGTEITRTILERLKGFDEAGMLGNNVTFKVRLPEENEAAT